MKKYIKVCLLIFWMALIFFLSSQVANESSNTTNFVINYIYKLYCLVAKEPLDIYSFAYTVFIPVRKLAHFSEFAILGGLMYINVKDFNIKNLMLLSIFLSLLYAISDEVHQIFVPGRAAMITDVLIDLCGIVIGVVIAHLISKRCRKD